MGRLVLAIVLSLGAAATAAATPSVAIAGPFRGDERVESSIRNQNAVVTARRQRSTTVTSESQPIADASPWEYRFRESSCDGEPGATACLRVACPDINQVGYLVERRLRDSTDAWQLVGTTCEDVDGPVLTEARILEEVRRIGLPSMSVETPPETFVNYETVVYTEAETFARTVNLLGFTVDIEATPSQFHWTYGDGTTETTTTAGRPYPATDITHTWTDAHRTFHPSVDVTYQIRFRVDGGDWQTLADTILAQGPDSDIRIREATGMLANMH
jgi:hypothetical protein